MVIQTPRHADYGAGQPPLSPCCAWLLQRVEQLEAELQWKGFRREVFGDERTGLVPMAAGVGPTYFLAADGTWLIPSGGGGGAWGGITGTLSDQTDLQDELDERALAGDITTSALTLTALRLAGRYAGTDGAIQPIIVGSGLALDGGTGTLTATVLSTTWGDLTGDLVDQPDLQAALDLKADAADLITDHGDLDGLADDDHAQYHNDARGDARYYTQAQVDSAIAAIVIPTVPTDCTYRRLEFFASASGNLTLTNHPSTEQFLSNSSRNLQLIDLATCTQVRISARVITASTSANSPRLVVKYKAGSYSASIGDYADAGTSEVAVSLATVTLANSGWISLAAGAVANDVIATVTQIGGDSDKDPAVCHVVVEFR